MVLRQATRPAKVILTNPASHMRAPVIFLHKNLTIWAVTCLYAHKIIHPLLHALFALARAIPMELLTTFFANFLFAILTSDFLVFPRNINNSVAFLIDTVYEVVGVFSYHLVNLKALIFGEGLFS